MGESRASSMFSAGSAVWREVISAPLDRVRRRGVPSRLDHPDSVNTIIESEIIPRLLMAHSTGDDTGRARGARAIDPDDALRFAQLPLHLEAAGLIEEVNAFLDRGASVETVCLDLLAPAARKLGEMWERDECDFVDVTMGLWRLQEVMRDIAARAPVTDGKLATPRTALFSPMPGDNHHFGAMMIDEVFSRGGWKSEVMVKPERRELLDRLAREPFDLVGLTLARDCPSAALGNLIRAMRNVSANPQIFVFVGGRMINDNPDVAIEVGADGTAPDALSALEVANSMVKTAATRDLNLR